MKWIEWQDERGVPHRACLRSSLKMGWPWHPYLYAGAGQFVTQRAVRQVSGLGHPPSGGGAWYWDATVFGFVPATAAELPSAVLAALSPMEST